MAKTRTKVTKKNDLGFNAKELSSSIHPADDFFRYVNGKWIEKTKIPHDRSRWGSFDILGEENTLALKEILEELTRKKSLARGSNEQKLRDLYLSGTNVEKRNALGHTPIEPYLKKIRGLKKEDLASYIAKLNMLGVDPFFTLWFDQDDKNTEKQAMRLHQGGLTMPDRDYYLKQDTQNKNIRTQYIRYIKKIMALVEYSTKEAQVFAETILRIETELARHALPKVETRDPIKNYNKKTARALKKEFAPFAWDIYLAGLRKEPIKEIIVDQKKYLTFVSKKINSLPIEDTRSYLTWHLLDGYASVLDDDFRNASFAFHGKTMTGAKKQRALWKQLASFINTSMGEAIGKIYVEKHFPKEAEVQMQEMVAEIKQVFRERITALTWMDKKTKKGAFKKLTSLSTKIGHPKKWQSYKALSVDSNNFAKNAINLSVFAMRRELKKVGKRPDKSAWFMSPATVNAYYTPNFNEIVFPAAILQYPFFDPRRDAGLNYGGIGYVIGHEISHAFDDSGKHFDYKGNMKNWWTAPSTKRFERATKVLEKSQKRSTKQR